MNPFEVRTLEAFLRAVSQMEKPLSLDLHQEIRRVGRALENHERDVIKEIPSLVERDAVLNELYKSAYRSLQKQYQAQERTKSLAIAVNESTSFDFESQIAQILNADDIAGVAKKFVSRLDSQLRDLSKQVQSSTPFWQKTTPVERAKEFREWVSQLPKTNVSLSDEAFSRESIYEE